MTDNIFFIIIIQIQKFTHTSSVLPLNCDSWIKHCSAPHKLLTIVSRNFWPIPPEKSGVTGSGLQSSYLTLTFSALPIDLFMTKIGAL